MKSKYWLSFLLILLLLLSSNAESTLAQSDDTPLDDEFVSALVMMSINHDLMAGKNELRDLSALNSFVTDYYDERIASVQDANTADWLRAQKGLLTTALEDEIKTKSGARWLIKMLDFFTGGDDGKNIQLNQPGIKRLVSGHSDPPQDYFDVMNTLIMTDIEAQVNLLLDIDIISIQPDLAPSITNSTTWSYNVPAIIDSTSPIAPMAINNPTVKNDTRAGNPSAATNVNKPIRFLNNGFDTVTVVVEKYTPATGYSAGKPTASTVVTPDGNSSTFLELPLGTYTFCYYWQLDSDLNNDGYFDYHHRTTQAASLNQNSSDSAESAVSVTLNPESAVSNPNGKCGENLAAGSTGLSPEEQANAGTHNYLITCYGADWCDAAASNDTLTVSFSEGVMIVDGETFHKVGPNQYSITMDGYVWYIKFNMTGFNYSADSKVGAFVYTLQP